jgi:hypothetical protein
VRIEAAPPAESAGGAEGGSSAAFARTSASRIEAVAVRKHPPTTDKRRGDASVTKGATSQVSFLRELWNNTSGREVSFPVAAPRSHGGPESHALYRKKEALMGDLILMVRLFIGIFYPKAVEPLQQNLTD